MFAGEADEQSTAADERQREFLASTTCRVQPRSAYLSTPRVSRFSSPSSALLLRCKAVWPDCSLLLIPTPVARFTSLQHAARHACTEFA